MFISIKKNVYWVIKFYGCINCVSLNNQLCQARLTLFEISSNEPLYYSFTVIDNKCG